MTIPTPTGETAAPGWYLDTLANRQRFWDGSEWQQFADEKPRRMKRRVPLWALITTGVIALFIGTGIGGAGKIEPSATSEFKALVSENRDMEDAVAESSDDLSDTKGELAEVRSELSAMRSEAAAAESARAELEQSQLDLTSRIAAVEAREMAVAAAEAAAAAPVVAPPATVPAPAPSAYYDNCTAVRAAGAAPIRAGQPGYGRHLDRDGDGVGCE